MTEIKRIKECPELLTAASEWFGAKWGIPAQAYLDSMAECLAEDVLEVTSEYKAGVPQWYLVLNEQQEIIAGAGIIENDFHDRPDLTPNLCALFVEEPYRCRGIAGEILNFARRDMQCLGYENLYLVTDHTEFYEKYGWVFLRTVMGDDGIPERMYAVSTAGCK